MSENRFTVIKGGLDEKPLRESAKEEYIFRDAYATDTRLMGVVGLCIHWNTRDESGTDELYQFFYLDAEEYAIENYVPIRGTDYAERHAVEITLMGGLGGKQISLTEREARLILLEFAALNEKYAQPLPDGKEEYEFLLSEIPDATSEERTAVMRKICTPIVNDAQLVHYFLMRLFGKDKTAARFLASQKADLDVYDDISAATLCKNTVDTDENSLMGTYMAESLLELDETYGLAVSRIETDGRGKIMSIERISFFPVSAAEAAMQLARPEFVTVFTLLFDPEAFESRCGNLIENAMVSSYENGQLYMVFRTDNDHVKRRVFLLNEDVDNLLYVTSNGQLLAVSYTLDGIRKLETAIQKSPVSSSAFPIAKYEFNDPIVFDFIRSDFEDFSEFLDAIQSDDPENQ